MHEHLIKFLNYLMNYYQERNDIVYVEYDGSAEPAKFRVDPLREINMEENLDEMISWLNDYLSEWEQVNYYQLYKSLIKDFLGIWVNPSLDELREYNCQNNLPENFSLVDMPDCEKLWFADIVSKTKTNYEEDGYTILSGCEFIEYIVNLYDEEVSEQVTLSEWIDSSFIENIEEDAYYLLDLEIETMPLRLDKEFFYENDSQDFMIPEDFLMQYFESLIITKRGFESSEVMEETLLEINEYRNATDYSNSSSYETEKSTIEKLLAFKVSPSESFIEVIVDAFGETYSNHSDLETEKDVLDFVNEAYKKEEVDREAKSFNRKDFILSLMSDLMQSEFHSDSKPVEHTWGQFQVYGRTRN